MAADLRCILKRKLFCSALNECLSKHLKVLCLLLYDDAFASKKNCLFMIMLLHDSTYSVRASLASISSEVLYSSGDRDRSWDN